MKNYTTKKLEELASMMLEFEEVTFIKDKGVRRLQIINDFLTQTIEEMMECLPKEAKMPKIYKYHEGFNRCRKEFQENIKRLINK